MSILNFGSLNLDRVFEVDHVVRPGETLSSRAVSTFAGGKGANQSIALARAGASVAHAGKVGPDSDLLLDRLAAAGVDCRWIEQGSTPTGQAIIQVDPHGENAILLQPGANHAVGREHIDRVLNASTAEFLLAQNEISNVEHLLRAGIRRNIKICFNPAPFTEEVRGCPLDGLQMLIVNETEGGAIANTSDAAEISDRLSKKFPRVEIVLTLGSRGVVYRHGNIHHQLTAQPVAAVDTTAAGDTFIGFFLAARMRGESVTTALAEACTAAALCVQRRGAMDSIPTRAEMLTSR